MLFLFCGLPSFPFEKLEKLDGIKVAFGLVTQIAFPDLAIRCDAVIAGRLDGFAVGGNETYISISP